MPRTSPKRFPEISRIECPDCRRQAREAALRGSEPRDAAPEDAVPELAIAELGPEPEDAPPGQKPGVIGRLWRCSHCGHLKRDHQRFSSVPVRSTEERCTDCDCVIINGRLAPWLTPKVAS